MWPFDPQNSDPAAGVDPGTFDKVRAEWDSFMGNPQGRAALLSAGLAMMQPPSFGDTPMAQIARGIGAAGESATANQVMGMKERDQESKADLRGAQAMAAEARAGTAEARAGAAGSRLELQKAQIDAANQRNNLNNRVRLSNLYQNYIKDVAKRNADPLRTTPPDPVLPMGDWIAQNPMLKNMGLVGAPAGAAATSDDGDDDTEVPAAASTTSAPQAPRDPSQRTPNTVYETPRGKMKWTGTGWVSP